jgi:Dullard-like phosphatase family protein
MNNVDSLTINKNDSEHYNYPENLQSNETKQTNFFSPIINSSHIPDNISINENTRKKDFIKINSQTVNKKTLVLDLDETLVHSSMTPFPKGSDLTIEINVAGNKYNVYVLKRPFLEEFLKEMSYLYEILVFTASLAEYAEPLLEILDKNKIIKYKLNRSHCLFYQGTYIKDLKVINRNIKDLIIIDNNPASYVLNQENGIPILSWFDNPNDRELMRLVPLLKYLSKVSDVRSIIKQIIDKDDNHKLDFNIIDKIIDKKTNNDNNATLLNNQVTKNNLNINANTSNVNNNISLNANNNISSNVNNNISSNVNNNNITSHVNNNITSNDNNNFTSNANNSTIFSNINNNIASNTIIILKILASMKVLLLIKTIIIKI